MQLQDHLLDGLQDAGQAQLNLNRPVASDTKDAMMRRI